MDDILDRIWTTIRGAGIERGDNRFDDTKVNTVILGPAAWLELRSSQEAYRENLIKMVSYDGRYSHWEIFDMRIVIDANLGPDSHKIDAGYMMDYYEAFRC